jgi:microcystin degradation protein MlrC
MLDGALEQSAFGTLYDPAVVEAAHRAGVGATLRVALGARFDRLHGDPLELDVYVKALTDGRFRRTSPMGRGQTVDLGKMARLVVRGVDIVVASVRTQVLDPQPFALHGVDVAECRVVGLKSSAHFRAGFEGLARHIVSTDPPGLSTSTLANFPYQRVRRPVYPLDRDTRYAPETL